MDAEMQMEMAKMFFAVMFGGDRFEPYIGQLGVSSIVDKLVTEAAGGGMSAGEDGGIDLDEIKEVQLKREVQCALDLVQRLRPIAVEGKTDEFAAYVRSETEEMSRSTFGQPLLHAIGSAYVLQAQMHLGYNESFLGIDGHVAAMKLKTRQLGNQMEFASKGYSSLKAVKNLSDLAEEAKQESIKTLEPPTEDELKAKYESYMEISLKSLKALCVERELDTKSCLEKADMVKLLHEP
eukprot:FR741726.1.p1 GENE.FR741726.1~~FR741726.1.p1  ORF type:complete len:237 (+),score=53.80 FR741726.1:1-711(+)